MYYLAMTFSSRASSARPFDETDRRALTHELKRLRLVPDRHIAPATTKVEQAFLKFEKSLSRRQKQIEGNQQVKQLERIEGAVAKTTRLIQRLNSKSTKRLRLNTAIKLDRQWKDGGRLLHQIGKDKVECILDDSLLIQGAVKDAITRTKKKRHKERKDGLDEISKLAQSIEDVLVEHGIESSPTMHTIAELISFMVRRCRMGFSRGSIETAVARARLPGSEESDASDAAEEDGV